VTSKAGGIAPNINHHFPLFLSNGFINQPLFGIVGLKIAKIRKKILKEK
jgi:hypothetical protein